MVVAEQRDEIADRGVGGNCFKPRDHDIPHRQFERLFGAFEQRAEHVALVHETDDIVIFNDRKLRHVGGAHAHECGAQRIVGMHDHRLSHREAGDNDIAHGAAALLIPAFLRDVGRIENLREIFRTGIAH
jgi:hypothetical protein